MQLHPALNRIPLDDREVPVKCLRNGKKRQHPGSQCLDYSALGRSRTCPVVWVNLNFLDRHALCAIPRFLPDEQVKIQTDAVPARRPLSGIAGRSEKLRKCR